MLSLNIPYLDGLNNFGRAGVMFFVLLIVLRILLYFVEIIFIKITSKTKTDLDDIILKKSSGPLTYLSIIISAIIALNEIPFASNISNIINRILYTLLAIVLGYLIFVIVNLSLSRVWKKFAAKTKSNIDDTIGQLVQEVLRIVLLFIIVLLILNIWGFEIGPFLAGLGIAGLAVALALQPTLSNIFSGIALIIDGTFKVGDVIQLADGKMGEVFKIGLRTTRVKSFDNDMIIIPNSEIANSTIQNFLQPDSSIRVNVEFGVEYGVDPEYVKKLVMEEIESIKFIDKDKEIRALFTEMAESSLNFKAMFWVDDISKKWPAHQEAMTKIYRRLYKEKIGIPYPQHTVWVRDEGKVKSPEPTDTKFKKVQGKYYSAFGHEYKEEKPEVEEHKEEKEEGKKKFLGRFRK
jgi:MscS family membrane protein